MRGKFRVLFIGAEGIHLSRWIEYFKQIYEVKHLIFKTNPPSNETCFYINGDLSKLKKLLQYRKFLRQYNPDIIIFHYIDYKTVLSLFSYNTPCVLVGYGYDVFEAPKRSFFFKKYFKFVANKSAKVFSIAEHMTAEMIEYIGVNKKKIYTTAWGCDTKIFYRNMTIEKNKEGIRIICPRGFEPHYNWRTLISAINEIIKKKKNVLLILTGTGSEEQEAKRMTVSLNLENYIEFRGFLKPEELAAEYNKANIYISLSLIDGNNISLNEAMACGAFPICSNIPAASQWITHNKNGFLLKNNFSYLELADLIISYNTNKDLILSAEILNYDILSESADFSKNMQKISCVLKELNQNNAI